MSETQALLLVARDPQRAALARRVGDGSIFAALRRLEALGLVRRHGERYRLTRRGRGELDLTRALLRCLP
jgi:DNA-binding PadR family transcriptional regulator